MMAIEQDHRRLNRYIELKTAEDSEMFDFQDNVRSEICFMIAGLKTAKPASKGVARSRSQGCSSCSFDSSRERASDCVCFERH